jgi:hypothetical protein
MDDLLLAYQIIEDAGEFVYQLYSNREPDIPLEKLKAKVKASDLIARVAVVGLGGAGKTTLIKTLTGCDKIDPRISNRGICPVIVGRENGGGWFSRATRTSIIYCDSEGQRPQTFVTSMLEADESDILHKGCFDVLIFVLDVKGPAKVMHRDDEIVDSVDWQRLTEHVEQWSDYALSMLFDTMSERLKVCFVFVNKCNLVKELSGSEKQKLKFQILDFISPFTQRLQPRMKGILFRVILGSARDMEEVAEVRQLVETKALNGGM